MDFPFTDKNREALENYTELWDEIKDQIETINGDNLTEYRKDFMKARFESNDDLPLSKILNIPVFIIIVKSVFQEHNDISMRINFSNQILLFTTWVRFHFCREILFFFQMKCQY